MKLLEENILVRQGHATRELKYEKAARLCPVIIVSIVLVYILYLLLYLIVNNSCFSISF